MVTVRRVLCQVTSGWGAGKGAAEPGTKMSAHGAQPGAGREEGRNREAAV